MQGCFGVDDFCVVLVVVLCDWFDESGVQVLVVVYIWYLYVVWDVGWLDCMLGCFLMLGELEGLFVLIFMLLFVELCDIVIGCEFVCCFGVYKLCVVWLFFCDYFVCIDWQVVLMDVLGVIYVGLQVVEDMCCVMVDILIVFWFGCVGWLVQIFGMWWVECILFVVIKVDYLYYLQYLCLIVIIGVMLCEVCDRVDFFGVWIEVMFIVLLCIIIEEVIWQEGEDLFVVCGMLMDGWQVVFYLGELLENFVELLVFVKEGVVNWLGGDYVIMDFVFVVSIMCVGDGLLYIWLDWVVEFLIGDQI